MEDDLGYLFAEVTTSDITQQELKSFLKDFARTTFPASYRWILFYYFGHGNEESIHLSNGDMKRVEIIISLKSMRQKELTKIVWFECCRLANSDHSPSSRVSEDICRAPAKQNQKSCGILTKYFTEIVTKLNAPLCVVMGKVNEAIYKTYKKEEIHIPTCEDHVIGVIYLLADSTGSCKCKSLMVRLCMRVS